MRTRKGPASRAPSSEVTSRHFFKKALNRSRTWLKAVNTAAQRVRKKIRKNVADGIAHVHASFNTIITITDRQGGAAVVGLEWWPGLGLAQEHTVRRPGGRGWLKPRGPGAGIRTSTFAHQGPGPGARVVSACAGLAGHHINSISDVAGSAQRLPPQKRRRI